MPPITSSANERIRSGGMERIENRTFDEIKPGNTASLVRTRTHKDIELFAIMSGDINPTHLDDAFAKSDKFHKVVAHGMWSGAGFSVAQSTVAKYMVKRCGPPSQGWLTFLRNHAPDIAAMDLFVVPTIGFRMLYGFVIVRLDRRDIVWINVTTNPTAEWVARQITEAFPWDGASGYMIRDRDRIYGAVVTPHLRAMGIRDKSIAPASPWQNGFAERLIGSIRRECLDHIVVLGEEHLRRILKSYADYYNGVRTHRSLNKDAPVSRPVQRSGVITSHAILGGLHHQYVRV